MSERERHISYDITNMCNLKNQYKSTYLQKKNIITDIENKGGRDKLGVWYLQMQTTIIK